MTSLKHRTDLTIDCVFCDKQMKVFDQYDSLRFIGYVIRCDACDFQTVLDSKYVSQLRTNNETQE